MVRVINIDTKTKTIHVSNEDKIDWITVKGTHVPIKEGENKGEAVKKFVSSKKDSIETKKEPLKESATDWYAKKFKSDKDMAPKNGVTFEQLYESLKRGESIYSKMGVDDSIVRERVFEEIATRLNKPYEHVYDMWLNGGEKGSEARKNKQKEDLATYDKLLKTKPDMDPEVKKLVVAARDRAKKELKQ